jgi:hypothetical protein
MVLLHYHVVPGLGDDTRPRPRPAATAVRGDQAALADCDDLALEATPADRAISSPAADTIRAAQRPLPSVPSAIAKPRVPNGAVRGGAGQADLVGAG